MSINLVSKRPSQGMTICTLPTIQSGAVSLAAPVSPVVGSASGHLLTAQEVVQRCQRLTAKGVPASVVNGSMSVAQQWKADMAVIASYCGSHFGMSRARAALLRWEDRA